MKTKRPAVFSFLSLFFSSLLSFTSLTSLAFLIFLIKFSDGRGEIEQFKISWNAFKCQSPCIELTKENFKKIEGIKDFTVNAEAGSADIKWDPNTPLTYDPFRYAAASVGFNIIEMRIRVTGKIRSDQQDIYLISHQDGTQFRLIGGIQTEPGRYPPKYNLNEHPLSLATRELLLDAEKQDKNITVAGPLFLPSYYYHPLTLITEQINVEKNKEK